MPKWIGHIGPIEVVLSSPQRLCTVLRQFMIFEPGHVGDGNGQPDIRASFDVPKDPKAQPRANVEALNPHNQSMRNVGKQKFSTLIVRVDDAIVVRVPLARP